MSENESTRQRPAYVYVLLALLCIGASGALGFWVGGLLGRSPQLDRFVEGDAQAPQAEEALVEIPEPVHWPEPPIYVYLGQAEPEILKAKVRQAAAEMPRDDGAAVRLFRFAVEAPLPWPEHGMAADTALAAVGAIAEACPDAEIILSVALDPPTAWLEANPDAVMTIGEEKQPFVSVASKKWREAALGNLASLVKTMENAPGGPNVTGYVLRCLQNGFWIQPEGYDRSEANVTGFREWLTVRYETVEAFRAAWNEKDAAFETAPVPKEIRGGDAHTVFHRFPGERRNIDYLRYVSENIADTLALLASQIKATGGHDTRVLAPYGFAFGPTTNCAGHAALNLLLDSEIDGFVSPPGLGDYGIDKSGGILGAVHSALRHGKSWFLLDDTLANASAQAESDEAAAKQLRQRLDHVFAVAVTQGMGLLWRIPVDTQESPTENSWHTLKSLKTLYSPITEAKPADGMTPFGRNENLLMTIVLAETSRFNQVCDTALNADLLQTLPSNVLRMGVPTQICLLGDLLAGTVPVTPCYLFLNTFHLPQENREALHALLRDTGATAIWVYAPGYCNGEANAAANIAATVQMTVKPLDKPVPSGSVVTLGGAWIPTGTQFGDGVAWSPSFYIEDDDVNVIARRTGSDKASVAIAFLGDEADEKSWTSVYCAEPVMPVGLLREIFRTLEVFQYVRSAPPASEDFYYFGRNSLAVHAGASGERIIDLGGVYKVQDLLDPAVGWSEKRLMTVPIEAGQTRIFKVMPVPEEVPNDESALPVPPEPQDAPAP
ncbi:MAG TPA: hypothetical protein PLM14_06265 [Candidatus Hydrogenedentes bacterium]|nr:hypothetical protein [Candidatus Hydrogenedentota bacterium]HQH53511.1 hypothetical protein [Candidatus Hydrogenedentota bacterium]